MNWVPMERIARQTLLGIRFWDRVLQRSVAEGLVVHAQRLSEDRSQRFGRAVAGRTTPGGIIAFFGLHADERVSDNPDDQIWATVPSSRLVVVDVTDRSRRYLPLSFVVQVPLAAPGAFQGRGNWLLTPLLRPIPPTGEEPGVFLWTAPTRPAPDSRAQIFAQVVVGDKDNPPPASYALVEVTQPGLSSFQHFGIADHNGSLMLPIPYPPIPEPPILEPPIPEPPNGHYPALQDQTFPLTITVHYQADHQKTLPGSEVPDIESLLTQPSALIGTRWSDAPDPALQTASTHDVLLHYGVPLVLRTTIDSPDADSTEPFLRIQPQES